jgi:hypothetical protein
MTDKLTESAIVVARQYRTINRPKSRSARACHAAAPALQYALALAAFALTIWGFVEIGCLRGTSGSNTHGPDPLVRANRRG